MTGPRCRIIQHASRGDWNHPNLADGKADRSRARRRRWDYAFSRERGRPGRYDVNAYSFTG